jgi:hypothetical protein
MSNFLGSTSVRVAAISVENRPLTFSAWRWSAEEGFQFDFSGNWGDTYLLRSSSDLKNWIPVYTNQLSDLPTFFPNKSTKDKQPNNDAFHENQEPIDCRLTPAGPGVCQSKPTCGS